MVPSSPERWMALRAVYEGAEATLPRLALAAGRSIESVERRAAQDGWKAGAASARRGARRPRLDKAVDTLIAAVEALSGEGWRKLDKQQIDTVLAMTRTLDKLGEMAGAADAAEETQARSDEDLAAVLRRIDERIVELAVDYARRVVGPSHPA